MTRGRRTTVERGISKDAYGFSAYVCMAGQRRERRFPADTALRLIREWRADTKRLLARTAPTGKGTLSADVTRYLKLVTSLKSWVAVRAELRAWVARYGDRRRSDLGPEDVLEARVAWLAAGKSPKCVNNRLASLRRLYRVLDGRPGYPAPTSPCDTVAPLRVERHPPMLVSADLVRTVYAELLAGEAAKRLPDAKTRGRFAVLASCGCRASELMRALPEDVDLAGRSWRIRSGKGGRRPSAMFLNSDMLSAWKVFIAAGAWGAFSTTAMARVLRTAGWPKGLRPYALRHSVGIELSERGSDLGDISGFLGHARIDTTRGYYVPVLSSRMKTASESLDQRFRWHEITAPSYGTQRKH